MAGAQIPVGRGWTPTANLIIFQPLSPAPFPAHLFISDSFYFSSCVAILSFFQVPFFPLLVSLAYLLSVFNPSSSSVSLFLFSFHSPSLISFIPSSLRMSLQLCVSLSLPVPFCLSVLCWHFMWESALFLFLSPLSVLSPPNNLSFSLPPCLLPLSSQCQFLSPYSSLHLSFLFSEKGAGTQRTVCHMMHNDG